AGARPRRHRAGGGAEPEADEAVGAGVVGGGGGAADEVARRVGGQAGAAGDLEVLGGGGAGVPEGDVGGEALADGVEGEADLVAALLALLQRQAEALQHVQGGFERRGAGRPRGRAATAAAQNDRLG